MLLEDLSRQGSFIEKTSGKGDETWLVMGNLALLR